MESKPRFPTSPQDASKNTAQRIIQLRDNIFISKENRGYLTFVIALYICMFGALCELGGDGFLVGVVAGLILNTIILIIGYIGFRFNHAHALRPEYDWVEEYREDRE